MSKGAKGYHQPENSSLKQELIEKLVDELMKNRPDQKVVRLLSNKLGIPYSQDTLTQMNTILMNLNTNDSMEI